MKRAIGVALVLLLVVLAGEARAWTPFGTVENITRMEDVGLSTPEGEPLYLGHKTSTVYFILGVYVSDDGYVLGVRSKPAYIGDMPPPDVLARLQQQGQLPKPLPPYHLSIGDYLWGYSLWIVLAVIAGGYAYAHRIIFAGRRRRRTRE